MKRKIHGHFIVRKLKDNVEVHRVPCHYREDTPTWYRVERGLLTKVDQNSYWLDWEPDGS